MALLLRMPIALLRAPEHQIAFLADGAVMALRGCPHDEEQDWQSAAGHVAHRLESSTCGCGGWYNHG